MAFFILRCVSKGFPNSPSEYAALAAQTVIGQVLEGVAPLSDDARVQALSITMTAFMEAWMEHILRQKIKFRCVLEHRLCYPATWWHIIENRAVWYVCVWLFTHTCHIKANHFQMLTNVLLLCVFSVQGALQLKQDFDSIREMIQSDQYGLSAELHQQLLSLRYHHLSFSLIHCHLHLLVKSLLNIN